MTPFHPNHARPGLNPRKKPPRPPRATDVGIPGVERGAQGPWWSPGGPPAASCPLQRQLHVVSTRSWCPEGRVCPLALRHIPCIKKKPPVSPG